MEVKTCATIQRRKSGKRKKRKKRKSGRIWLRRKKESVVRLCGNPLLLSLIRREYLFFPRTVMLTSVS